MKIDFPNEMNCEAHTSNIDAKKAATYYIRSCVYSRDDNND
jgi:hypothetical protein